MKGESKKRKRRKKMSWMVTGEERESERRVDGGEERKGEGKGRAEE